MVLAVGCGESVSAGHLAPAASVETLSDAPPHGNAVQLAVGAHQVRLRYHAGGVWCCSELTCGVAVHAEESAHRGRAGLSPVGGGVDGEGRPGSLRRGRRRRRRAPRASREDRAADFDVAEPPGIGAMPCWGRWPTTQRCRSSCSRTTSAASVSSASARRDPERLHAAPKRHAAHAQHACRLLAATAGSLERASDPHDLG